ncbi:MAG: HpsJ family protein [Cyanobacteria bacterium P01_F01_bin.150]
MQSSLGYQSSGSNNVNYSRSIVVMRWIGYLLVALFLLDIVALLYPLDLMNPEWEFQTVGNIVERIVVPIMGLGFIFWGEGHLRRKWEMLLINLLSWTTLVAAVVLIIAFPLILVTSSQRIAVQIDTNFGDQYQQQVAQAEALQEQIESSSQADFVAFLESQGGTEVTNSPEEARQNMLDGIVTARQELRNQITKEINQRKMLVKKNSAKWILGAMISGFCLAYVWYLTRWARLSLKAMKEVISRREMASR